MALAAGGVSPLYINHLDNGGTDHATVLLGLRAGDAVVLCSPSGAAVFDVTGAASGTDEISVPVAARTANPTHTNVLPGASEATDVYICKGP